MAAGQGGLTLSLRLAWPDVDLELSLTEVPRIVWSNVSVVAENRAALVAIVLHRGKSNPAGSRLPRKRLGGRPESIPNLISHAQLLAEAPAATSNSIKIYYRLTKASAHNFPSLAVLSHDLHPSHNFHLQSLLLSLAQGSLHSPIAEGRLTVATSIPPGFCCLRGQTNAAERRNGSRDPLGLL